MSALEQLEALRREVNDLIALARQIESERDTLKAENVALRHVLTAARNAVALPLEHECNHADVVWDLQAALRRVREALGRDL